MVQVSLLRSCARVVSPVAIASSLEPMSSTSNNWSPGETWTKYFEVPASRVLYTDEQVVAFLDRKPRAEKHVLVVPRHKYIKGVEDLDSSHRALLEHMGQVGSSLTGCQPKYMGFHQFPLRSVNHLHLHCLCEPFVSNKQKLRFTPRPMFPRYGYVTLSSVLARKELNQSANPNS